MAYAGELQNGHIHALRADLTRAIAAYTSAVSASSQSAEAHARVALVLFTEDQLRIITDAYQEALKEPLDDPANHARLASALDRMGAGEGLVATRQHIVELAPDERDNWLLLSQALWEIAEYEKAVSTLSSAAAQFPEDLYVLDRYATTLQWAALFPEAASVYQSVLRLVPPTSEDHAYFISGLGLAVEGLGETNAAIRTYQEGLAWHPDSRELQESLKAALHFGAAGPVSDGTRGILGQMRTVVEAARDVAERNSLNASNYTALAHALRRQGSDKASILACVKALSLDAGHQHARTLLAETLLLRNQERAADAIRDQESGWFARTFASYVRLGDALEDQHRLAEAIAAYAAAVALASEPVRAPHLKLAHAYFRSGDYAAARRHLTAASEANPQADLDEDWIRELLGKT